jgi:outer membrane protein OmpA-like peptidoglycan-associated protein
MLKKAAPSVADAAVDVKRTFAVNFDTASSTLSDQSIEVLKEVIASGSKLHAPFITLTGYTDAVGSPDVNLRLAQSRVDAVAAELTKMGVNPGAITLHAAGAVPGEGASEANRRVDIALGGPAWDSHWRYGGYAYGARDHGWGWGANNFALFFDIGSSNLSADGAARLKHIVDSHKHLKPKSVDVIGFTDSTGSAATNQRLARERAEVVAAEISQQSGIATNVFSRPGDGWGWRNDGRARRVEILFHY